MQHRVDIDGDYYNEGYRSTHSFTHSLDRLTGDGSLRRPPDIAISRSPTMSQPASAVSRTPTSILRLHTYKLSILPWHCKRSRSVFLSVCDLGPHFRNFSKTFSKEVSKMWLLFFSRVCLFCRRHREITDVL